MGNSGIPAKANDTTSEIESLKAEVEKYKKEAEVATKRHRDTQSAYTKERQNHLALQAKLKVLEDEMQQATNTYVPELEELKLTDPDAWYMELQKRKTQSDQLRNQKIAEAVAQQTNVYLAETRANILEDFNSRHPDSMLTAEFLNEEIPLRIKKLQDEGNYEAFLQAAYEWGKKAVVGDSNTKVVTNTPKQPNLGNMGGVSEDITTTPPKPKQIFY